MVSSLEADVQNDPEVAIAHEDDSVETYHDPNKLIRISTWANTISWIILAFTVILTAGRIYTDGQQIVTAVQQSAGELPWIEVVMYVVERLQSSLLVGAFYFLALPALSEGINIWLDIQEGVSA